MGVPVTVVAEPGSTHEGRLIAMLRLVELAADIGCDVFKNQWVSSPEELCARRRAPEYLAAYRKIHYPSGWHKIVAAHCAAGGLRYACSVYLPADVAVVAPYCSFLKCASFEQGATDLMWSLAQAKQDAVVSLGMGGATPPRELPILDGGTLYLTRLACVSAYPTPDDQMNLARIRREDLDGLSDHSKHPWAGALAVAAGATMVEFHLRLDDASPDNADYAVARTPAEAREYVANIRTAEAMLGDGDRRLQPSEAAMTRYLVR